MALRFPDWFRKRYPEAMSALSKNADKLTTPFDIHETLLDALDYNKDKEKRGIQLNSKRETLLRKINMTRDCLSVINLFIEIYIHNFIYFKFIKNIIYILLLK